MFDIDFSMLYQCRVDTTVKTNLLLHILLFNYYTFIDTFFFHLLFSTISFFLYCHLWTLLIYISQYWLWRLLRARRIQHFCFSVTIVTLPLDLIWPTISDKIFGTNAKFPCFWGSPSPWNNVDIFGLQAAWNCYSTLMKEGGGKKQKITEN